MRKHFLMLVLVPAAIAALISIFGGPNAADATIHDTGWVNPSANARDTGGNGWGLNINPQNAYSDWNGWAACWDCPGNRHRYYNYNINTAGATSVRGIKVRLDWWLQTADPNSYFKVELSWNGGTSWTPPKISTLHPTGETTEIIGNNNTDLWGHNWTLSELSNANFRVRLTNYCAGTCTTQDWNLDWVPMKVYFSDTNPGPPGQPATGPGGSSYSYASYAVVDQGSQQDRYWIYEPRSPQPDTSPVIVFNHGWGAIRPYNDYSKWIIHLVRRGNIVIMPQYQNDALTTPNTEYTQNAINAVNNAIDWLQANPTHVQPDLTKFAIFGHSYGGPVTVNMANQWQAQGLPQPKAIMPVQPYNAVIDASLAGIPSTTLVNCHVGQDDTVAGRAGCDTIWDRITQIPDANKDYVWMYTDRHGTENLVADHFVPVCDPQEEFWADALDFYGYWKSFDGLLNCAFYGTDCAYGIGNTPEHRNMGTWTDGVSVTQLSITKTKP